MVPSAFAQTRKKTTPAAPVETAPTPLNAIEPASLTSSASPIRTAATISSYPSQAAPTPFSGLGVVAQAAAQSGVRQCLPRMDQVVNFLSATSQTGAMVFAAPSEPDQRTASIGLEVLGNNGLSYIDTTYNPSSNGCDASYAQVTYWENSCSELASSGFPGFARVSQMRQHIGVLDGGPSAKVFLMPAGTGCVSIKKEVIY